MTLAQEKGEFRLIRSLIRLSLRPSGAAAFALAILAASSFSAHLFAQTDVPAAPAQAPAAVAGPEFPKPEPGDFDAESPTKAQVAAFLQASWGYDTNRVYQVQRIQKTVVPGISNVVVLVGEKGHKESGALQFFALADGKHIITSGEILPFGDHPYVENRETLLKRADGPTEGAAGKDLEIVEFAASRQALTFDEVPCCESAPGVTSLEVAAVSI